jgi:hypothetical protein
MHITITCPRCGGKKCEWGPKEMFCEDCLLLEYFPRYPWRDRADHELLLLWDEHLETSLASRNQEPPTDLLGENIEKIAPSENE